MTDYIYIRSKLYGCYHMKIKNKYKDKKNDKYKEWKIKKEKEYEDKVFTYIFDSLSEKRKKILFEKYDNMEDIKMLYIRFNSNMC